MNTVWDIIYARRPLLNYVSPPVCEVIFSGSANPIIILSEPQIGKVTGIAIGGFGGFQLTWNAFPGAICYNVYFIGGDNVAVILAQCVTDTNFVVPDDLGDGNIVITPITLEGEGPPSDPFPAPTGAGGGTATVTVEARCNITTREDFPAVFTISREPGDTIGNLAVTFTLTGTAVNGVDYDLVPLTAIIPNGANSVDVTINPIDAVLTTNKTVILTLNDAGSFSRGDPFTATVQISRPYVRIKDYGTLVPLLTPAPAGGVVETAMPSDGCEWAGTLNLEFTFPPVPGPEFVYYYQDGDGHYLHDDPPGINESVQGTKIGQVILAGPFSGPTTWQVQILGRKEDGSNYVIWQGTRGSGTSPDGVYNRAGTVMSDLRLTLEFEVFP